jgi:uncharacterized protein
MKLYESIMSWSCSRRLQLSRFIAFVLLIMLTPGCVNRLFYHPNSIPYRNQDALGSPVKEVTLKSGDGTQLHGWYIQSTASNVLGTVVHFHGNAQNLTAHSSFVDWLPDEGYNLFMFDYRGYGKSGGKPSRKGLFMDGIAALEKVRTLPGVDTNRIVIIGQSLGGTTALAIAGRHPELAGQAIISDSSFYSYRRIVRDKIKTIPLLSLVRVPLSWLVIGDAYSPAPTIGNISPTPVLFMHGTADIVIPMHHSKWLYDHSKEPKKLLIIEGGEHISGMYVEKDEVRPQILAFLAEALADE